MKIKLLYNYSDNSIRLTEIERQLEEVEEKLKTPERTVEDLVLHMQLIKERNSLL